MFNFLHMLWSHFIEVFFMNFNKILKFIISLIIFCCYHFYEENGTDFSFMGCHIILLGMLQFFMESMGMEIFSSHILLVCLVTYPLM